jgi:hypothetical protein
MTAATFPASYAMDSKNFVQGPGRVWHAPYVTAGGNAPQGTLISIGLFTKDGQEYDHKLTFMDADSDQSLYAIETFLTKEEIDVKVTWQELSPANLNRALGQAAGSLTGPPAVQGLGQPFDIATGIPSTRPIYEQWIFQFPSPGHDGTTSPIAAWAYLQLFKATVVAHGPIKIGKEHLGTIQTTIRGYTDTSIADQTQRVGLLYLP